MRKKKLWKDIFKSISNSKGRFFSIFGLMLLGSFALVGLKVTGPDMRATGEKYLNELNSADITVISPLGLDSTDKKILNMTKGIQHIEYGYLKDVVIKGSTESIRLYSKGENLSSYHLMQGKLPEQSNEIALDEMLKDKYKIGDTFEISEKADVTGTKILKTTKYKVVGFLYSSEILSNINMGQSASGSGELKGYGVVTKETFNSQYYMLARMSFIDTQGVDPYSDGYTDKIQQHKKSLSKLLKDQPEIRLTEIRKEYQEQIDTGQKKIDNTRKQLADTKKQLNSENLKINDSQVQIETAQHAIALKESQLGTTELVNNNEIQIAKSELANREKELTSAKEELAEKQKEYAKKESIAIEAIADNEQKLKDAQETLNKLKAPVYSLNSRREIPGSEGYKTYSTISKIVDALANVFPIFLYFVAALVTSTTMARFVDEERINSGTLKALGYSNKDVLKKFTFYGLVSSLLGTIVGVIMGHILLPLIVYNAYHDGFVFQNIELHFDPWITSIAVIFAIVSSVVPAWLVAARELKERPAALLLPKIPAAGSKILLERVSFIWKRMSFTHKVTARNIFRYKKRMFMTIFGVAGAVALLFAGFSVQHSIGGISDRQFSEIIHYDMIVAENDTLLDKQKTDIEEQLKAEKVKESLSIHFESMTKVAGSNKDTQDIKLLVPSDNSEFKNYVTLENRKNNDSLKLPEDGIVISERLAKLLNIHEGDTITLNDTDNQSHKMKVSGITEMYMGHFAFTSKTGYEKIFEKDYKTNAYLVNLKNSSLSNTEKQAARFMNLAGVEGVVQNTTLINQVHIIVDSLNKIMKVLIVIAALLGIVILYNLTNINVSERIRELSTIKVLGFYNKEVTMYIYRETILLTLLGLFAGFGLGELLHQYIITVVPPDDVMFNPSLGAASFWIPALIITIVTIILGLVVNHRLKNIDMLEALKSVD